MHLVESLSVGNILVTQYFTVNTDILTVVLYFFCFNFYFFYTLVFFLYVTFSATGTPSPDYSAVFDLSNYLKSQDNREVSLKVLSTK